MFAEVDETEVEYFKRDDAPYVNADILTDDYSNALPEALRSPPKGKPLPNSQLPAMLRSPSNTVDRGEEENNIYNNTMSKPSFGLRSSSNSNVMAHHQRSISDLSSKDQQQHNNTSAPAPAAAPSQQKGSIARKLPVRMNQGGANANNNNSRRVSFSDDENSNPTSLAASTPTTAFALPKKSALKNNTSSSAKLDLDDEQTSFNQMNNNFMMGFKDSSSGWNNSAVTSTPMTNNRNNNNENNSNLGDTETKVRELMKKQSTDMIKSYNDRAINHHSNTSSTSPFPAAASTNAPYAHQEQPSPAAQTPSFVSNLFAKHVDGNTSVNSNNNNNNKQNNSAPASLSMNEITGLNTPSFLSGMFTSLKKNSTTATTAASSSLDDDEKPPGSLTPKPAAPPTTIRSTDKQNNGNANNKNADQSSSTTTRVVMPSLNFAEYENDDDESPPRLPPGLTPPSSSSSRGTKNDLGLSPDSPRLDSDEDFSPDNNNKRNNRPTSTMSSELFNRIRAQDAAGKLDKEGNFAEEEEATREQSAESALGIRAFLNGSGKNTTTSIPSSNTNDNNNNNNNNKAPLKNANKMIFGGKPLRQSSAQREEDEMHSNNFANAFATNTYKQEAQLEAEKTASAVAASKMMMQPQLPAGVVRSVSPQRSTPVPKNNNKKALVVDQYSAPTTNTDGGLNFEEVDDSPPGVSISEFLPSSATKKDHQQNDDTAENTSNKEADDYSPIKSALYFDPYLVKNQPKTQQDSPAMDRLRFGYAAASETVNSPSGNSKSITFHHHQQKDDNENEQQNTNMSQNNINTSQVSYQSGQYYSPSSGTYHNNNNTDLVPKAAVPVASLMSAGKDSSPPNSMDAVLGQRTASATKKEREHQHQSLSRQRSGTSNRLDFSSSSYVQNDDDEEEKQRLQQQAVTPQGGIRPSNAAPTRRSAASVLLQKQQNQHHQRRNSNSNLDLLQSNMNLNGEDDKDLRSFVRNLKDAETGKPVKQMSMSPERLNRNSFTTVYSPEAVQMQQENDSTATTVLPPPSSFALEQRKLRNEKQHEQEEASSKNKNTNNHHEEHLQHEGFASSPNARKVEPTRSTTSSSVVRVRVAANTTTANTTQVPTADFDFSDMVDASPDTRKLQGWQIDRTPRQLPEGTQAMNPSSISPSFRRENSEHHHQENHSSSRLRERDAALEELNRPLSSLQRKRVQLKYNTSNGNEIDSTSVIHHHHQNSSSSSRDDVSVMMMNDEELAEFAPSSNGRSSSRNNNHNGNHNNNNNNNNRTAPALPPASSYARRDAHQAYLALRSKQSSNSAFYAEEGENPMNNNDDDEDVEMDERNIVSEKANAGEKKKPQVSFSLSRQRENRNMTVGGGDARKPSSSSPLRNVSPSSRFMSPASSSRQQTSASRRKAELMEKHLAAVSPMNRLSHLHMSNSRAASPISSSSQDSAIVHVRESGVLHEEDVDDLPENGEWQWTTRRLVIAGSVAIGVIIVIILAILGFVLF